MNPSALAAALVDPFPTWLPEAESEAALLKLLVSCPQADIFEPWEPGDRWTARVLFPDLADSAQLLAHGPLVNGVPPGLSEWIDRGRVGEDVLEVAGLRAVCRSDHEAGLLIPDLLIVPGEPEITGDFREASTPESTVEAVIHRHTGRAGLCFRVPVVDEDVVSERLAVLQSVASLGLPLAPDLRWWFEVGKVTVLGYWISPPVPLLPVDHSLEGAAGPGSWSGPWELQVAFPAATSEADTLALCETFGEANLLGARPRYHQRHLLSVWEGERFEVAVEAPHRWVPGCPSGLEADWVGVDPSWWSRGSRYIVRYYSPLQDRDLLPRCISRAADEVDAVIIEALGSLGPMEPVWADVGALRLTLPAMDANSWGAVVEALCQYPSVSVGTVLYAAMGADFIVLIRRPDLKPPQPPQWAVASLSVAQRCNSSRSERL